MKTIRVLFLSVLGFCISGGAQAASVSDTIAVSTTVLASCSVATSPLAFTAYDSGGGADGTAGIDVTCTNLTAYKVAIDAGSNFDAPNGTRRMAHASLTSTYLSYKIWTDATYQAEWGDSGYGDTINQSAVAGVGSGFLQNYTVYGTMPTGQNVPPGNYTDTVTVTVNY